jgi:putative salt-induced outer membrane protein YdiY
MRQEKALLVIALASIVWAGSALGEDAPPDPWSGSGELSFVSTAGNTDTETLGLGFEIAYKPGVWTTEAKVGYLRAESDGELTAEKLTGLLGLRRSLNERFDLYARTTFLQNEFAGVDSNWGLEAGGIYKALTGDRHFLDLSAGLGYTSEDRVSGESLEFAMATLGAVYKWKISESTDFTNDFGFVYDLEDSEDWRIANTTAIAASINKLFSLKVSYGLNYQNEPAQGFEKRDAVTAVALVAKF